VSKGKGDGHKTAKKTEQHDAATEEGKKTVFPGKKKTPAEENMKASCTARMKEGQQDTHKKEKLK